MDSEERLRALREAAAGCVIRLDPEGRIVEFDAAAGDLFGCRAEDALGRPLSEVVLAALLRDLQQQARLEAQLGEAVKDLQSLVHSISHDLRAPLRHLDGFVSLLRDEAGAGLSGDARHFLDVIAESAQQMNRLIESLLALSRVGTASLCPTVVDMSQLVAEVVQEAMSQARGRNIAWDIGLLPAASGDRALLHKAWACLVDNAIKFTRQKPLAEIAIGATQSAGEWVYFVRDNGAGFDTSYAGKLFGVFQRLHNPREFEGAGVGLAIVRRIVARHGGKTWAEGRTGAGATVYFSLPGS